MELSSNLNRGLEGETPLDDISGLKPRWVRTVKDLEAVEFENISKAVDKYLGRRPTPLVAPFSLDWIIQVHGEMLSKVWSWAGKLRQKDGYNIGIAAYRIGLELESLSQSVACWKDEGGDVCEQAAMLHHRAVWIHPFHNGNGRWSRLLSQTWEYQQTGSYTEWPEAKIWDGVSAIRSEYIGALREADTGNYEPLILLHARYNQRR